MPVIGFLAEGGEVPHLLLAFRQGLAEAGYVEGKNLAIEYRFGSLRPEPLAQWASDSLSSAAWLMPSS